ncbi:MAG: hypothetical protein CMM07_08340 [Rhodopirellula sp.]|nr:hypothetical protein [Rhodopirellula sp.]
MIDFDSRLQKLKDRRQGTRERALIEEGLSALSVRDPRKKEKWETNNEKPGVKYAIGAMAEVSRESTQVSTSEGERVASTLNSSLETAGIPTTHRLQGSVPLNVHIEGHSDVDVLIILTKTILVQTPKLDGTKCEAEDQRPMKDIVKELRLESEGKLTSRYHQAKVDCSNNKSIAMSGGSLKRKVDIVPACWYDNHKYQETRAEHDRGVHIYHKGDHKLIGNLPFTHIHLINQKDHLYSGNLKKVIRLLKTVIADMPIYKKIDAQKLSSYDLAGISYHMDNELKVPSYFDLALVEKTRSHLAFLVNNPDYRDALTVPDGSRKIFDSEKKVSALKVLHNEIEALADAIMREINPNKFLYDGSILTNKMVIL